MNLNIGPVEQIQAPLAPERCGHCQEWSQDAAYTGVCSDCYALALADHAKAIAEWGKPPRSIWDGEVAPEIKAMITKLTKDYREVMDRLAKT